MAEPSDYPEGAARTIHLEGGDKIAYLVNLLERAYFETKEPKHKRWLAAILSKLA